MATNLTVSSSKQSNFRSSRWYNGLLLPSPIIDRTLNGVHVPLQFTSHWEALPLLPSSISSYCLLIHSMGRLAFPNRYTCDWKTLMPVLANLVKVVTPVLLHAFWKTLNLVRTSYIGDLMSKITGSDLIIKCLKMYDVDTIFGIAGDHILHLLEKLNP